MEEEQRANRTTRTEIGHEVRADTFVLMETARVKARQERLEREMNRRLHADMAVQSAAVHREVGPIAEQEDDEAVHDELAMTGRGKAQVEPPLEIFPIRCCGQERFTLAVRTSTILQIKHKIADLYGMAVENQSLHLTPDPEDEGLSDDHEVAVPGVLFLVQKFDLPDPALPMDWDGEGGWPDDRNITVEEVTAEELEIRDIDSELR